MGVESSLVYLVDPEMGVSAIREGRLFPTEILDSAEYAARRASRGRVATSDRFMLVVNPPEPFLPVTVSSYRKYLKTYRHGDNGRWGHFTAKVVGQQTKGM